MCLNVFNSVQIFDAKTRLTFTYNLSQQPALALPYTVPAFPCVPVEADGDRTLHEL